ncbi:MAG: DUF3995 domain-containing protein [Thermoanaerobaculia bacterium]
MIPALLASTLVFLGGLHVYWALGGRWGKAAAIPQVGGQPAFTPSRLMTLLVALALFGAAFIAVIRGYFLLSSFPGSPAHWTCIALGLLFLLRAIGEFRLVGFFKRVRGTPFATLDTRLFSPLSLLIAIGFLYIATT